MIDGYTAFIPLDGIGISEFAVLYANKKITFTRILVGTEFMIASYLIGGWEMQLFLILYIIFVILLLACLVAIIVLIHTDKKLLKIEQRKIYYFGKR